MVELMHLGTAKGPIRLGLALFQPRVGDGLAHGDMRIGGAGSHEPQGALVHVIGGVDLECSGDPAAKAVLGHFGNGLDPRTSGLEGGGDLLGVVSNGRDDPQPGNDDAAHARPPLACPVTGVGYAGGGEQGSCHVDAQTGILVESP
jgi:hypothetical protein